MTMNRTILILGMFIVLAVPVAGYSQSFVPGKGQFIVDVDIARFFGDEQQVYVEIYYGIHENSISYVGGASGYRSSVRMRLVVRGESASVANKEWLVPHEIIDTVRLSGAQIMTGLESLALPAGAYSVQITASDVNAPGRSDSVNINLPIVMYPQGNEAMSDVELCTMIQSSSNKQSLFYKNTLEVTPNPARLFGVGLPIMYYYFEVYNLISASSPANSVIRTVVLNSAGKEVFTKDKQKPRTNNSSVEIGSVNLSAMKGGTYTFRANLLDSSKTVTLATTSKKFFIYKPGTLPDSMPVQSQFDISGSEYAVMPEEEADRELACIAYLVNESERVQITTLADLTSKQRFLFEFWRRKNPDPQSGVNEFKKEYMNRIQYAETNFMSGLRKGWKSDKGRVYVLYGPADEIERFPNSPEANPYEIWHFNSLQGGVEFVFVDRYSMGDYSLVHSTHRDELHNPDWYRDYAGKAQ